MAGKKGKRLHKCGECGHTQYVHWTAAERAARVRCEACGSARMEMSTGGAKAAAERLAAARQRAARIDGNTPAPKIPPRVD